MIDTTSSTDRIEKQVTLKAPRARVWRALSDVNQFNEWFGVNLIGEFAPGATLRGSIRHPGYEHLTMEVTIDEMQAERLLAWRWHPGGEGNDVEKKPSEQTRVVFELSDVEGGTLLKVIETGFDAVPISRRERAYRENEDGWTGQMKAIEQYVGKTS